VIAAVPDAGVPQPDPEEFPDPIPVPSDDESQAGNDVSDPLSGPALPYLQVEVEYLLATLVDFVPAIWPARTTPVQDDGCGGRFYLTGASITLAATVNALVTSNPVGGTLYTWHVTGAQVAAGTVDMPSTNPAITLQLATPGTVRITVDVDVRTTVGSGIQTVQQSTVRTAKLSLLVLTESQAELAQVLCRLFQETLPIRRLVFPGDPAKRLSPADTGQLHALAVQVQEHAATLARLLDVVLRERR